MGSFQPFPPPECGGFRTYLDVREHPTGAGDWLLLAPLVYDTGILRIEVPEGFRTDFASVPQGLRSFVSTIGGHTKPAVIHDWLYRTQPAGVTRRDADYLFRRGMREMGVGLIRRNMAYMAVRAGGWISWSRSAKALEDGRAET